ncbi:hypothetical protein GCM10023193_27530 [Planotetraspora kaengkrachanensis]
MWTIRDEGGYPAPLVAPDRRSMPFWSSRSRVIKIIKNVATYAGFEPVAISLDVWVGDWLPELSQDNMLVGINWSGTRVVGWDFEVPEVIARLNAASTHQP